MCIVALRLHVIHNRVCAVNITYMYTYIVIKDRLRVIFN